MDPYNSSSVSGEDANSLHLQNTHQLHFASSQSHPQIPQSLAQANLQSHKTSSQDHSSDDDSDSKEGATEQDKKLRRLLKNRESAHQSRIRKKNYISELEKRTAELSSSNSDLQTRVNTLTTENKLLKDQLAYLRLVLSQAATSAYPTPIGSQPPSQAYPPTPLNAQSASQAFAGIASSMQFANTLSQTGLFDPPRK
eukprot:TRINITY_DN4506_c0_g1_i1.p2 TRINITY_DN4506_c0_g1~~TRINITY_DN4506_c0_g1_i1.p2  ORF type:complete len:197 (-),score=51.01 TRINITY_DN4506_c0_g1_i1:796-1386(-)